MKLLEDKTNLAVNACAELLLDTVPLVARTIRLEMRRNGPSDLSVPQFRVLTFLKRHSGASLSDVAEHIGLTLPASSNLIDRLVTRNLVNRQSTSEDRRRIALDLTPGGESTVQSASEAALAHLAETLAILSTEERAIVTQAMLTLRTVFGSPQSSSELKADPQNEQKEVK